MSAGQRRPAPPVAGPPPPAVLHKLKAWSGHGWSLPAPPRPTLTGPHPTAPRSERQLVENGSPPQYTSARREPGPDGSLLAGRRGASPASDHQSRSSILHLMRASPSTQRRNGSVT